jgi:hypothetical protein
MKKKMKKTKKLTTTTTTPAILPSLYQLVINYILYISNYAFIIREIQI